MTERKVGFIASAEEMFVKADRLEENGVIVSLNGMLLWQIGGGTLVQASFQERGSRGGIQSCD